MIASQEVFLVTDTFCGSAAYASPEILERRTHDARSADVWALGIVFFIVLVGSMPFDDTNIKSVPVPVPLRLYKRLVMFC